MFTSRTNTGVCSPRTVQDCRMYMYAGQSNICQKCEKDRYLSNQ